jgi:hypothetical protein
MMRLVREGASRKICTNVEHHDALRIIRY